MTLAPDLVRNKSGLDPALMTFAEYRKRVNPHGKGHDSRAYDLSLASLNDHFNIAEYPRILRQFRTNGINFSIRTNTDAFGDNYAIVNDDGQRVGTLQDEWGTSLVMVAREYRGFGIGEMLGKLALQQTPDRPTGGETQRGYETLKKAHRALVGDALKSGRYRELIQSGKISVNRVKEIVNDANLKARSTPVERNLNSRDPRDLLLYGSDTTFVLYNRHLKDVINEEDDYWIEKMVMGMIHFNYHTAANGKEYAIIYRFGGDRPQVKSLLLRCAAHIAAREGVILVVDKDDLPYVDDRYLGQSHVSNASGMSRAEVYVTGEDLDPSGMIAQEIRFRKSFDRYDEFYHRMVEIADAKYRNY